VQPTVDELVIADDPDSWRAVGFDVTGESCEVGTVRVRLEGRGEQRGIVAWSVRGARTTELDGLVTASSGGPPASGAPHASGGPHPNGVVAIDHLVVMSPDLDRTAGVLREAGFDFRRLRQGETPGGSTRQAFFRMGEVILEVVEAPEGTKIRASPDGPARLWGLAFLVEDMDRTAATLGDLLGTPRDAVQPGRRIATLRPAAGLGPAIAFMTPGARAA
jgi:Glyoxalase-like domain